MRINHGPHIPLEGDPDRQLSKMIAMIMGYSDATHVTQFGNSKLWPVYEYFSNQSKYRASRPSSHAAHHFAFFPNALSSRCPIIRFLNAFYSNRSRKIFKIIFGTRGQGGFSCCHYTSSTRTFLCVMGQNSQQGFFVRISAWHGCKLQGWSTTTDLSSSLHIFS